VRIKRGMIKGTFAQGQLLSMLILFCTHHSISATDVPHTELPAFMNNDLFVATYQGKLKCTHGICQRIEGVVLLPMVGMVVTSSPYFSLYRAEVFPAASRPSSVKI